MGKSIMADVLQCRLFQGLNSVAWQKYRCLAGRYTARQLCILDNQDTEQLCSPCTGTFFIHFVILFYYKCFHSYESNCANSIKGMRYSVFVICHGFFCFKVPLPITFVTMGYLIPFYNVRTNCK